MSWLLDGKFNLFHWLAAGPGFKIENASPGVTLAVVAGIILYITRFDVAISNVGMIRALLQPREAVSDPKADPKQGTDSRTIEIPVPVDHPQFWLGAVIAEFVESMLKGIFGTVFIFAGIHLISQGLDVNQTSWVAEFLGFRFSDLGPGTVLTVVGTGFIWKSKFDVAAKNVALGRNQLTAPVARKQPA
jgi:hypothetical protein